MDLDCSVATKSLKGSKYVPYLKKKSDAAAVLRSMIAEYVSPADLKLGSIHTAEGGEFEGEFQYFLVAHGITHELNTPHMLQYSGVAE